MAADTETPKDSGDSNHDDSSFFDEQLFKRVRSIEEEQEVIDRMDGSIGRIKQELESLKSALHSLPSEERRLMTVLVARSIKRSLREILIEQVAAGE